MIACFKYNGEKLESVTAYLTKADLIKALNESDLLKIEYHLKLVMVYEVLCSWRAEEWPFPFTISIKGEGTPLELYLSQVKPPALFKTRTTFELAPNPTIRVRSVPTPDQPFEQVANDLAFHVEVPLVAYYPDFDNRMKFRGYAIVKGDDLLTELGSLVRNLGRGYWEVNELGLYEPDNKALKRYCHFQRDYTPIELEDWRKAREA